MQHKFFTGAVVGALSLFCVSCHSTKGSHSKNVMPGTWQATPVVIDGDSKDWPSPYPNYDAKALVAYATSNDKQYLYVTMETGDYLTQLKILKKGMTVSIDTLGNRESQLSINYPLENDNDEVDLKRSRSKSTSGDAQNYESKKMEQDLNKLMQSANQFTLEGFSTCNGGYIITQNTPCGVKVRASIDEYKELVWEAAIPFKLIYNKDSITALDAARHISVCFAVNSFTHPKKADSGGDNGGGMSSNGGGMGGGGMGGRGGGGRGGGGKGGGSKQTTDPYESLYEHTKTWKQFNIVYQAH